MQVILLQDVKGVGKKGQTVDVSDGYANNYLVPRRLAVILTKRSQEILDNQIEAKRQAEEDKRAEAERLKTQLESIIVEFQAVAGKDGRMFGSISGKQICEVLKSKHGIIIDKRKFVDRDTVNVFGTTIVKVELYKGIIGTFKVHVVEKER